MIRQFILKNPWLLFALFFLLAATALFADTALIQIGEDGRPLVLPIPSPPAPVSATPTPVQIVPTPPPPPTAKAVTDTGTLPPLESPGYIYYTLPGGLHLVTPWSAGIVAEGYDFIGKESITQGFLPLASFWKVTGVMGGGINPRGEGSPMGGAIVNLANVKLSPDADFHVAITGGYNFNAKHALAVVSGSVKFLK